MKLFSKVLCILSVLVLCVPFFCLSVSAAEASDDEILPPYYGIDAFKAHVDGSGFKMKAEDIDENGLPTLFESNYLETGLSEDEINSKYKIKVKNNYMNKSPYSVVAGNAINYADKYIMFTKSLTSAVMQNNMTLNTTDEYYYFTFFYEYSQPYKGDYDGYEYTKTKYNACYTLLSTTPFTFTQSGSYFFLNGSSNFSKYFGGSLYQEFNVKTDDNITFGYAPGGLGFYSSARTSIKFDSNMNYVHGRSLDEWDITLSKCYTNCDIDTSMFDSDENLVKGLSELERETAGFEKDIDVKLTPEFGYDMDRVFDTTTGRNDYFKLEVTNNSDTAIQFCASIVDGTFKDSYENDSFSSSSGSFGDTTDSSSANDGNTINPNSDHNGYNLINTSHWNYITQTSYYYPTYKFDDGFLFDDVIISSEYRMGNYYFIYLKPGEHFEDCIYWENVNIIANHEYTFVIQAIPTSLEYATDIFYYTLDYKKIYPFVTDTVTDLDFAGTSFLEDFFGFDFEDDEYQFGPDDIFNYAVSSTIDLSVNKAFYKYALSLDDVRTCYCQPFSVKTIPAFTTEVSGGNSKITSGWSDTQAQANNPYYRNDNATGEILPVTNYSEFNGNSMNGFSYDINNASVDDVMSYLDYSKNFFSLIGATLNTFPSFIWGLIAFGLSAFVVIAIVKWIIT